MKQTVKITDAGIRWLDEVGHRDHCGCPEDHRIHRVLTVRPARDGGWLPNAGFRRGELLATRAEVRSLGDCADAAWMVADEMSEYDPWPAGCLKALAAMRDRCYAASR